MGRRLHLLKRNDVFWWRRRLPRALTARGDPGEIRRSLGSSEPALARLRALRLTTAFEEVLLSHAKTLRSPRPLTRWEREQILGELYGKILEEAVFCSWYAMTHCSCKKGGEDGQHKESTVPPDENHLTGRTSLTMFTQHT